jgi:hypothetical protein
MRVKPSALTAIAAILGYLVIVFGVWAATGLDYDAVGDTVENVHLQPMDTGWADGAASGRGAVCGRVRASCRTQVSRWSIRKSVTPAPSQRCGPGKPWNVKRSAASVRP